jgi:thiamine biosynthesis lipoprotein
MTDRQFFRGSFPAMGTTVTLTGVDVAPAAFRLALADARALAEAWEARFSRFRPESQLCRLNAAAGAPVAADAAFLDLLERARTAAIRTAGRFDPSVLPALEAAGYDATFDRVRVRAASVARPAIPASGIAAWRAVGIDRSRGQATLPPGMRIDLGGIAKGAFVDLLAERLARWPGGCVDAGGDLRVWGRAPAGDGWVVGIEDPARPDTDLAAVVASPPLCGAIATSAPNRRRWTVNGTTRHHLIDPATGDSLALPLASITVFAPTVTAAEVATKALLVAAARGEPADLVDGTLAARVGLDGRLDWITREAS